MTLASIEAAEAAERQTRAALHDRVQHGAYAAGHTNYIPAELLCVLAVEREGSRLHKILPAPGAGGYGTAPLNADELACALATSPEFARLVGRKGNG